VARVKVAAVHEWLETYGGSEQVLEQVLALFPQADLFTLVDFLPISRRRFLEGHRVTTSFIQKLPFARRRFRRYLPLMPFAIEQFDMSGYDLIISSSHAVAKGVISGPYQTHVSYVHTPMRYAWDLEGDYLGRGWRSLPARLLMHYLRIWDTRTTSGIDCLVANSAFIRQRIRKIYHRNAELIYPPVALEKFGVTIAKEDFYLVLSRLVPYKRVELAVDAFARMPQRRLLVIGDGPERKRLQTRATPNVEFLGRVSDEARRHYLERSKALVYAGLEDFGIALVEAQACGTPVIAYGRGGAAEIVKHGRTGILYMVQSAEAMVAAVEQFERGAPLDPFEIRQNAARFSVARFRSEFLAVIDRATGTRTDRPVPETADINYHSPIDGTSINGAAVCQSQS
jgi:glycosyltransferase involved in cell wall biosynthesis